MTVQQVIDAILAYHPNIGEREATTCDTLKSGDPNTEVKGIVTAIAPTVDVIRKTIELGYNMIIVHEPTFYSHMDQTDWLEDKIDVYEEKKKLLDDHGIAIWRDHDHLHANHPDGIYTGFLRRTGWEKYLLVDPDKPNRFQIPETTVRELAKFLKEKLNLNAIRVIGNLDGKCSKVAIAGHLLPGQGKAAIELLDEYDVIIPGELIDWEVTCYARDAAQLGKNKAIINTGHINREEPGMEYMSVWLKDLIDPSIPIQFVPAGDLFNYVF